MPDSNDLQQAITDRGGTLRAPVTHALFLPMFLCAMKTFQPFPDAGPRLTVGRTVLRRESWRTRAADRPAEASGMAAWAASLGLPRQAFCLVAGEAKPVYAQTSTAPP
ncbi:MAG: hypothetical protein JO168_05075 [Solirubrobacterales bacterium]|nr:hypothetical protein [Solirubrobacterales bacterium]MBV9714876.1 hypothetical protein [Solirubrobacterales bacterium]